MERKFETILSLFFKFEYYATPFEMMFELKSTLMLGNDLSQLRSLHLECFQSFANFGSREGYVSPFEMLSGLNKLVVTRQ